MAQRKESAGARTAGVRKAWVCSKDGLYTVWICGTVIIGGRRFASSLVLRQRSADSTARSCTGAPQVLLAACVRPPASPSFRYAAALERHLQRRLHILARFTGATHWRDSLARFTGATHWRTQCPPKPISTKPFP